MLAVAGITAIKTIVAASCSTVIETLVVECSLRRDYTAA